MDKLSVLLKPLDQMTEDELLDHIRRIREDRRISKRPEKPLTQRAKKAVTSGKLASLFANMTKAEKEALLQELTAEE